MLTHRKLAHDPLVSVKLPNPKTDRRRVRRMLLPEEWAYLDSATRLGPVREGVTGPERATMYAVAIQTGLRANEMRTLTVSRLHLHDDDPFILAKAKHTKNQRDARQYVRPGLAAELASLVAHKLPNALVFTMPDEWKVADVLREDLAQARRQWLAEPAARVDPAERLERERSDFLEAANAEGEYLDLHALRHTCGAWLAASGAHPNVVKSVMRHSSITLTMDTYGHLFPGEEAEATAAFDKLMPAPTSPQQATGTAGQIAERACSSTGSNRGANQRETMRADALVDPPASGAASDKKPLKNAGKCEEVRRDAGGDGKATDRNRTGNLRFTKPLLCQLSYGGVCLGLCPIGSKGVRHARLSSLFPRSSPLDPRSYLTSHRLDLNQRPELYESSALPLSYGGDEPGIVSDPRLGLPSRGSGLILDGYGTVGVGPCRGARGGYSSACVSCGSACSSSSFSGTGSTTTCTS